MNEKNQLLQKFIQHLTELIIDKYYASYDIIKIQGIKLGATLNGILVWQGAYREAEKKKKTGLINQKDFDEKIIIYIASMNLCLQQLDLDELEDDTLENFRLKKENENQKFANAGDETPSFEDLDELDDPRFNKKKIILEKIDITNIEIPESSDILDIPEKRYEFRKRMTNIQDYLTLGSYNKALEECEYILTNLELQSSQLYEYHAISYYKVKGEEYGIIHDIQEQKEETLKQLILCIKRCRLYNKKKIDTFENNVEFMCYRMSLFLREKYRGLPQYSYINQEDNPNLRNIISLYITTGLTLTTEVYNGNIPITVFLEYALTELIGGGKLEWFEVTTDWQIKNRDSFPALETRNAIINILKKTNSWEKCRKILSRNLLIKYTNIKNLNSKSSSNLAVRQAFLRFFKASIIAYKCFNDTRFLESFKGELLHTGKLSWLELDESGKTP